MGLERGRSGVYGGESRGVGEYRVEMLNWIIVNLQERVISM